MYKQYGHMNTCLGVVQWLNYELGSAEEVDKNIIDQW